MASRIIIIAATCVPEPNDDRSGDAERDQDSGGDAHDKAETKPEARRRSSAGGSTRGRPTRRDAGAATRGLALANKLDAARVVHHAATRARIAVRAYWNEINGTQCPGSFVTYSGRTVRPRHN